VDQPVDLPHGVASVFDDRVEPECPRNEAAVVQQPSSVDAAGTTGAAVYRPELV
jgi:hypothetical protein